MCSDTDLNTDKEGGLHSTEKRRPKRKVTCKKNIYSDDESGDASDGLEDIGMKPPKLKKILSVHSYNASVGEFNQ